MEVEGVLSGRKKMPKNEIGLGKKGLFSSMHLMSRHSKRNDAKHLPYFLNFDKSAI